MCTRCNYPEILDASDIGATRNRIRVLEVVGNNRYPLSAGEIIQTLERRESVNPVTVYRILDLLVERGVLERLSSGGRAFYYGLAPNEHHRPHPHFYCKACGQMECLDPDSLELGAGSLWRTFPGRIDKVEIRVDGICKNCLRTGDAAEPGGS